MPQKFKINPEHIIKLTFVVVACFTMIMATVQSKRITSLFHENIYGFTKANAVNIGVKLDEIGSGVWDVNYIPMPMCDYARYENPDVFNATPTYINELERMGMKKYTNTVSSHPHMRDFFTTALDTFHSTPVVSTALVVDKNGYIAFASRSGRAVLTGDTAVDTKKNIELTILSELSTAKMESAYIGDFTYKNTTGSFTKYPVVIDGKQWGSVVVFYNEDYLKQTTKDYTTSAMWMFVALFFVGGVLTVLLDCGGKNQ